MVDLQQVSVDSVLRGRLHTMLTYSISNNRVDRLIEDMLSLYFFGGEVLAVLVNLPFSFRICYLCWNKALDLHALRC